MAEQPTQQLHPSLSLTDATGHLEPPLHTTLAEVIATLRAAPRHRDDMQSDVYAKVAEADLATVIARLEQVAQQSAVKTSEIKKI